MTTASREAVATALFKLLSSSSGYNTTGRRFITDDQLSACQKPALFMYEHKETHVKSKQITPAVRTLDVDVYIFIAAGLDPNATPISQLNNLIDAIDPTTGGVLSPFPGSQQTLGGLVTNVYIDGEILKTPGDINGLGVAVIPVKVVYM